MLSAALHVQIVLRAVETGIELNIMFVVLIGFKFQSDEIIIALMFLYKLEMFWNVTVSWYSSNWWLLKMTLFIVSCYPPNKLYSVLCK